MPDRFRQFGINTKSFVYAVVIHLAVAVLLFASFDWGSTPVYPVAQSSQVEPVKATVVSEAEIEKQMDLIKAKEEQKQKQEQQAKKRLEDLRKQRALEQKRLADLKKKRQAEAAKAKQLAKKRKQEEARLAKLNKEKQRKAEEAAARKRREEEKRRAEERRSKELAEREAREKAQREAELKAQLEAEERARVQNAVADARSRYIPMIQQKVDRNWTRPSGLKGLTAGVRVRLTPGGEVISAEVVRSSGNPVFDRSVENAVLKASPLPIPTQRGVNEEFRDIRFNFDPDKNLIS